MSGGAKIGSDRGAERNQGFRSFSIIRDRVNEASNDVLRATPAGASLIAQLYDGALRRMLCASSRIIITNVHIRPPS